MRFCRAFDLGADGVGGLQGDDAAVCKDGEAPRSGKYEVAMGEGRGGIGPLAAIGQFASVDSASGMRCVVPATCGYTETKVRIRYAGSHNPRAWTLSTLSSAYERIDKSRDQQAG